MESSNKKEGLSVKEIEAFTKKHRVEVFFSAHFVIACFFSFIFLGAGWSLLGMAIGGILGVLFREKCTSMLKNIFSFILKQDSIVQLVIAAMSLVISLFLPLITFFLLGVSGGKGLYEAALESVPSENK